MNYKQRMFVEAYLKYWNATQAAREAGYKHPNKQGPRLLVNVGVKEAIAQRLHESGMEANEVIFRLSEHARADLGNYIQSDGNIDLDKLKEDGKTRLIKKFKITRRGNDDEEWIENVEIEIHDSQSALDKLAKIRSQYVNRTEHTGKDGDPIFVYGNIDLDDL